MSASVRCMGMAMFMRVGVNMVVVMICMYMESECNTIHVNRTAIASAYTAHVLSILKTDAFNGRVA